MTCIWVTFIYFEVLATKLYFCFMVQALIVTTDSLTLYEIAPGR